jgi:hypothetical protein
VKLTPSKLYKGADIRGLKASDKPYACRFGNGIYLWVTHKGTKSWQVHYHNAEGKHQAVMIGRWPAMGLDEA